jgi:dihydrofolate reductase
MRVEIIAAYNNKRAIGLNGGLPWAPIKQDMALFKRLTTGQTVIMGRKTQASIPPKFWPLPDRFNIVLSRQPERIENLGSAIQCVSLSQAVWEARNIDPQGRVLIIGGGELCNEALNLSGDLVSVMHLSLIDDDADGDVFFPKFCAADWYEDERKEYDGFAYKRLVKTHRSYR